LEGGRPSVAEWLALLKVLMPDRSTLPSSCIKCRWNNSVVGAGVPYLYSQPPPCTCLASI
jgi:hypothetical protein